jgi:hypothetical protein
MVSTESVLTILVFIAHSSVYSPVQNNVHLVILVL